MRVLGWSMRLGSIAFAVTVSLMFFQNCGGSFGVSENSARSLVSEHFDQFQSDQAQYKVDQLATGKLVENPHVFRTARRVYLLGSDRNIYESISLKNFSKGQYTKHQLKLDMTQPDVAPKGIGQIPNDVDLWSLAPYRDGQGQYHLYATIHIGNFKTAIAYFVPSNPSQIWEGDKPILNWRFSKLILGDFVNNTFHYDFKAIEDPATGKLYGVYTNQVNKENNVYIANMPSPDRVAGILSTTKGGQFKTEFAWSGTLPLLEGANIHFINGKYVMVYTTGSFFANNYKIGLAYSDRFTGPYEKVIVNDHQQLWGEAGEKAIAYLVQNEKPEAKNYLGNYVNAPGIGNIDYEDGQFYLVFHGNLLTEPTKECQPGRWHIPKQGTSCYNPAKRRAFRVALEIGKTFLGPKSEWIQLKDTSPRLDLSWTKREGALYSLDLELTNGERVPVCAGADTLGNTNSFTFRESCPDQNNLHIPMNHVAKVFVYSSIPYPDGSWNFDSVKVAVADYKGQTNSLFVPFLEAPLIKNAGSSFLGEACKQKGCIWVIGRNFANDSKIDIRYPSGDKVIASLTPQESSSFTNGDRVLVVYLPTEALGSALRTTGLKVWVTSPSLGKWSNGFDINP